MRARLLANLNWLLADKLLRLIGGLAIGIWMARYLGPSGFGVLSLALAFVALFSSVARLGLDQIVIRDLTRRPADEGEILGTLFGLKLACSLAALPVVVVSAWFFRHGNWQFSWLVIIIALGMIFNALDSYDIYYQAKLLSRHAVVARSISFLLFSAIRVALILGHFSVYYFAVAATMEIALGGSGMAWIYYRRHKADIKWRFGFTTMRSLLKDGWPLILSSALIFIHTRVDQVMIGKMLGDGEVGIYSVAIRVSDSWLFVPAMIVQTVTPYLITLRDKDPEHYRRRLLQLYSIMFWMGMLVGVFTMIFGKFLVVKLFGVAYRESYLPLILTIWTGIFISQAIARGIWMIGENLQRYRLFHNMVAVPLNIVLNLLLIPIYGVVGAATASLISVGVTTWFVPFLFKPMRISNKHLLSSLNPRYMFG